MKNRPFRKILSLSLIITSLLAYVPATVISAYAVETTTAATTAASNGNTSTTAANSTNKTANSLWPQAPSITSESAILIDADTGAILYQKDAYEKCYPASTTKILTGLLTIENCSMDETVTFSSAAANSVTWEDASLGTKTGEEYTVEQSLYGLLLYSANEIAYGLAEHVSGNLTSFTELMNTRAKELGAINTHFSNASGLYDPNHYTTAYDMAMIARGCYNNSTFVSIDSTSTSYTIPPTNVTAQPRTFKHRHQMLENRPYYYEFCKGGKTGFTDQSGCTLVTFAEKNNMRLICVCFKSGDSERFIDTRALFDWGFDNFQKITISGDTISSLFSNSNYYSSNVFGKYQLSSNLNASTLTIPNNASTGDINITVPDNNTNANTNSDSFTTDVNFTYNNNIVGTARLTMASDSKIYSNSQLPYLNTSTVDKNVSAKKCISINIWLFIAIIVALVLTIFIIFKNKRKKYRRTRKRNLHF